MIAMLIHAASKNDESFWACFSFSEGPGPAVAAVLGFGLHFFVPQGALSEPEEPMSEVEEMGGSFTNLRSYENHWESNH